MKRPPGLVYGLEDAPPLGVTLFSALQHVIVIAIRLLFPLLVAREAGLEPERILDVLGLSMMVMAVVTVLQGLPRGPVGSGYLCPASFTSAYIAPSMLAGKTGGIALVAGMTLFGGIVEMALSRLLRPLRPYFPPEIAGLVVVVVGITLGAIGTRNVLGIGTLAGATPVSLAVTAASLGTMIALNVWAPGNLRVFCALTGMVAGYVAAAFSGILTVADLKPVAAAPYVHFPTLGHLGWAFDPALAIPFAVAALAASLRAIGDVTACQKINDLEWTRPDMRSLGGGVLANGLGTVAAGLVGSIGVNTLSSGVGLSSATGVTSRRVAYAIGAIFVVLAFLPKVAALIAVMPRPVVGATLWFAAAFILINGLQIVTSRMFDIRRTLVFGLALTLALAVEFHPAVFAAAPAAVLPFTGSALVLGTVSALLLNAVFRIGLRRTGSLTVAPGQVDVRRMEQFMETQGGAWGARRDVIERATFNLAQSIETILGSGAAAGSLDVEASFDEFNLDVRVSYDGLPLDLPDTRPTNEEIMGSEEGERKLAGFMLRRFADRVAATQKSGRSTILFHFDH
jgi:NCS2 family nucleobase:cation symporter-2